jgi:hypothetical protein
MVEQKIVDCLQMTQYGGCLVDGIGQVRASLVARQPEVRGSDLKWRV